MMSNTVFNNNLSYIADSLFNFFPNLNISITSTEDYQSILISDTEKDLAIYEIDSSINNCQELIWDIVFFVKEVTASYDA